MKQPLIATQYPNHQHPGHHQPIHQHQRFGLDPVSVLSRLGVTTNLATRAIAGLFLVLALALASTQVVADPAASQERGSVVNINTADAATLAQNLRGVGQSRAQEIVRHREAFGPFASPDELLEVKGIGRSTLDQNRARITLE